MRQKGVWVALFAVLLSALLAGCSGSAPATAEPTATAEPIVEAAATAETGETDSVDTGTATTGPVQNVIAMTEVFGTGQQVTAVAVEYDEEIDNAGLSQTAFAVDGRTVTNVYANTAAEMTTDGSNGKYVIVELQEEESIDSMGSGMGGGTPPDGGDRPSGDAATPPDDADAASGGAELGDTGESDASAEAPIAMTATITQVENLVTVDGVTLEPDGEARVSDQAINLVVDDFQQFEYADPETGITLQYNLYIPKDYDASKSYPMVLFMHDAGEVGDEVTSTLTQGLGAVIWATPEEQAKHESFVLAPQYARVIADDNSETLADADATVNLIEYLKTQYSIDPDRLYTTGQSMGCMTSIALLIKYPDLFAGAMLVAGQWDASLVAPMATDKLWIIVSEGDSKAYPGMDAITAALEEEGATVSRATWNPESTPEEFDADVSAMLAEGADIQYTVLEGGNHNYTWQIAYTIEGIRDWLFAQTKAAGETSAAESTATTAALESAAAADSLIFDNSAWNYDAENDVYWQIGVQYSTTPETLNYETMGIYVPGAYLTGTDNGDGSYSVTLNTEETISGYTAATAPIVIPVNTPGYSAHAAPTEYSYESVSSYLNAGFIYLDAGMRGRSNGYDDSGNLIYSGGAPWGVTDLKAAVRYYRYNRTILPGDTDSIFTFGMSGGGAQSALMGATGDSELYIPYLESIGAAMVDTDGNAVSDAVAGTMAWCPITSLDTADEAYEWNMGQYTTTGTRADDTWTSALSADLAGLYADYINAAGITDADGNVLTLEASDEGIYAAGSYYDYLVGVVEESLNNFLIDTTFPYTETAGGFGGPGGGGPGGARPEGAPDGAAPVTQAITSTETTTSTQAVVSTGTVTSTTYATAQEYIDSLNAEAEWVAYDVATNTATISGLADFVAYVKTAGKNVAAFDDLDRGQAENMVFGNDESDALHFDPLLAGLLVDNQAEYSAYADWNAAYADAYATDLEALDKLDNGIQDRQNMYNPMYYLLAYYDGYQTSTVARYWRINTGIEQGDTASTVEANLALALEHYAGVEDVAFTTVWGQGHTQAERTGNSTDNFINWVNQILAE